MISQAKKPNVQLTPISTAVIPNSTRTHGSLARNMPFARDAMRSFTNNMM